MRDKLLAERVIFLVLFDRCSVR